MVYSGGGVLLTSTKDTVWWWEPAFEDLLNPTDMSSVEEANLVTRGTARPSLDQFFILEDT